ncbi:hypothetical protein I4U23_025381 [Adineta vaga]|nr:hypothetical protein I4U23_025381 [Adineta vaga]
MNLMRMHQCGNVNYHCQVKESLVDDNNRATFTRTVYQVDATTICRIIKRNEYQCLYKSFGQLLYLASKDRQRKKSRHQIDNLLLLQNVQDLIPIAIHWNLSQCTTSDVEDLVSFIDPFITLRELFYDVTTNDTPIKQLNLIGLICFYGGSIEVFFSYEHSICKWLFCFDGNITVVNDWNAVRSKCIDFHLQPFLLIYVNSQQNPVDITQLLRRTVIQEKILPCERRLEPSIRSMTKQEQYQCNVNIFQHDFEDPSKICSFASLNSSMLFLPKSTSPPTSSYINQETVAKVMQQQLSKKGESLSDITSPLVHIRTQKQKMDETLSSGDSSTSSSLSSQRDSGLGSGITDGSSDDSLTDSTDPTEQMMNDTHLDMTLASIEYYLEQSLKYESASHYSSALESCQRALTLIDQILYLHHNNNTRITTYLRPRKNSLLLRIRSLKRRQIEYEESNPIPVKPVESKQENKLSILTSSTRLLSRPKKNVKFSDNVALIVPRFDDDNEAPREHLIHSFLRNIHKQQQQQKHQDSETDSPSSSMNDIPIGLIECTLCHKRISNTNHIGNYCSNCHFYMQRFQPINS